MLVKCRDLRALCRILAEMVAIYVLCRILAEMSRFMCFVRHKFSAARHLKLFCTPAASTDLAQMQKFFNGRDAGAGDPVLRQTIETVQVIAWSAFW